MLNRMLRYADTIVKRGVDKLIDAIGHNPELQTKNAETQAQNATSNGGDASRGCWKMPDAGQGKLLEIFAYLIENE